MQVLSAGPDHLNPAQAQLVDHLLEEDRPAQQRFDESDREVRADKGQHHSRQASTASYVCDARSRRYRGRHYRTVEQMSLPQSVPFAGSEDAPQNSLGPQQFGVRLDKRKCVPKHDGVSGFT